MQFEQAITSELESFVEVNLEAHLLIQSEMGRPSPVEILVLSTTGAILRSDSAPTIGDLISLLIKSDFPSSLLGKVKSYLNWSESKKVFIVKFEDLNQEQNQALQQMVDYFTRLKRAGVRLGS